MKKYWLILSIVALAFFLRVYKLDKYPGGFTWDEAASGYNAYSILKTGRDEYGKLFPLIFKSFGDYKPGFYIYLTVPSILIFGLNEFAVRLPSAIFGTLLVFFLYLLAGETENNQRDKKLPILVALVAAVNPWLIHFSRGAWEANVALFEVVVGFYCFLKFVNVKKYYFGLISSLLFGLSFITYQTAKVFTPLIVFGIIFLWRENIKKLSLKKKLFILFPVCLFFLLINLGILNGETSGRLKVMSLFSYRRSESEIELIKKEGGSAEKWSFPLFHSEPLAFLRGIFGRYLNYFSGKFLLFEGDWGSKRHGPPYTGMMLLVSFPFFILGIFHIFSKKKNNLEKLLIYWLLVAPIPAALTRDSIQAVRSLPLSIPLVIFTAVGVNYFLTLIKQPKFLFLAEFLLIFIMFLNLIYYFDLYFIHYPIYSAKDWVFGYKEVAELINQKKNNYKKIVVTQKFGQPYIFYLFYSKYNPEKYQKQAYLTENSYGDVGEVKSLDNIEFREIYWPADRGIKNGLFIGSEFELPLQDLTDFEKFSVLKEIKYPDGGLAFRIVETK